MSTKAAPVRHAENNVRTIAISQKPRVARGNDVSVGYPREVSSAAVVGIWAATVIASWMLVGFVVVGIWWLVT